MVLLVSTRRTRRPWVVLISAALPMPLLRDVPSEVL
jgi:hypothetical protein